MADVDEKDDPKEDQPIAVGSDDVTDEKSTDKTDSDLPEKALPESAKKGRLRMFKTLGAKYWAKKKWTLPATVLVLLIIILAIPFTRYASLGLFLKSDVTVTLTDSVTKTPVSSAAVTVGGRSVYTDANGKVTTKLKLGNQNLKITKQYYQTTNKSVTVTLSKSHNAFAVRLVANGRQVPITVINKITGKPVSGAEVVVLAKIATASKTDKNGKATIVLPTKSTTEKASVTGAGYNALNVTVQVTDKVVAANTFSLTPSGKLYFLSNQSGKIDVVKTNLDGTDRQTILAGTGSEDPNTTSLLASQDWKYLALLSRRSGTDASLYLINTSNDKLTTMDEGKADFSLIGWAGDTFAYHVFRRYDAWQPKGTAIKTYNAATGKLNVVYETGATGDANNYTNEGLYWVQEIGTKLVWYTSWSSHSAYTTNQFNDLNSLQARVVEYDTVNNTKKTIKSYDLPSASPYYTTYFGPMSSYQSVVYSPDEIYFLINSNDGNNTNYYDEYENGAVTENSAEAKTYFSGSQNAYPTYLLSPSNKQTFWSEERDGKNTIFVGDDEGKNGKQIASLSEYQTYGWYTDNYLLLSKNSSELYIMPADGSVPPQKITDYYKPPTTYRGYGGGYGGI